LARHLAENLSSLISQAHRAVLRTEDRFWEALFIGHPRLQKLNQKYGATSFGNFLIPK